MQNPQPHTPCKSIPLLALAILLTLHTKAQTYQHNNISLSGKHIPLSSVFRSIKKQTGLSVFSDPKHINTSEKVSVNFKQLPLETVLHRLFHQRGIKWSYHRYTIHLYKRPNAS